MLCFLPPLQLEVVYFFCGCGVVVEFDGVSYLGMAKVMKM